MIESSGEWRDERLWVLKTLEKLEDEQRREVESAALMSQGQLIKASKDIQEAHIKIRALEKARRNLSIKYWIVTGVLSVATALLLKVLERYFHP
jgi:hypothetical protein